MQSVGRGVVWQGQGGGVKKKKPPHGPFSIHWARSSTPVLQQLPARLVRVNKPSAKVKETYKEDIMQTMISLDPEEPQIEWHNCLCSFSIWKWITERCSCFPDCLMNSIWAVYTLLTWTTLWIQKKDGISNELKWKFLTKIWTVVICMSILGKKKILSSSVTHRFFSTDSAWLQLEALTWLIYMFMFCVCLCVAFLNAASTQSGDC